MYFILVKILDTTGPLVAGLSRGGGGGKTNKKGTNIFFRNISKCQK